MAERNYNLIELGPWGTGKSFVYRETTPNAILISGGKVTVAQLFVNMSSGRVGLLGMWDVVAFDEVAGLQMSDSTVVNMLKDYMESGSFARGKEEIPPRRRSCSSATRASLTRNSSARAHLFADLPKAMIDPAFLDRLHYYLPGWEVAEARAAALHRPLRLRVRLLRRGAAAAPQADLRAGHRQRLRARRRTCQPATRRPCARLSRVCSRSFIRTGSGLTASSASTSSSRWRADAESRSSSRSSPPTTTPRPHSPTSNGTPAASSGWRFPEQPDEHRSSRSLSEATVVDEAL